jgi:hypothetical protein
MHIGKILNASIQYNTYTSKLLSRIDMTLQKISADEELKITKDVFGNF